MCSQYDSRWDQEAARQDALIVFFLLLHREGSQFDNFLLEGRVLSAGLFVRVVIYLQTYLPQWLSRSEPHLLPSHFC